MRAILLAALLSACSPAYAHNSWINFGGYKAPDGTHCCGEGDCAVIPDDSVKTSPMGYTLSSGELVPYAEALPSEDSHYWRCKKMDGSRRCFFAPQPGS